MTVTLCIETSTAHCSLALAVGDRVCVRHEKLLRRHNEQVLPMLDSLYQEAGISVRKTQLIGFGAGPGSFTGVRIAASVAQGIGMASGAVVVPMAGSQILLRSAQAAGFAAHPDGLWLTVVPSRADAFYLALYRSGEQGEITAVQDDRLYIATPQWLDDLLPSANAIQGLGPKPDWLTPVIAFAAEADLELAATAMVEPVRNAYSAGLAKPAAMALPIYVEGDSPWQKSASANVAQPGE